MAPTWAAQYIGIPFLDCGRSFAGLDCWGLVKMVLAREFGCTALPDFTSQYRHARDRSLAKVFIDEMARWQRVRGPVAGDVAVFHFGGRPMHVGLVVADNWMLSIDRRTASCLERLDSPRWSGKLEGFYRYEGARVPV